MAIRRAAQLAELSDLEWHFLLDDPLEPSFEELGLKCDLDRPTAERNRARELWVKHGEALLPRFIKAHPGRRPRCWWSFEAPELRAIVRGSAVPLPALGFDLGLPRNLQTWSGVVFYESEAAYLDRYGWLSPSERRRLGADDYAPVRFRHWWENRTYDSVLRGSGQIADVLNFRTDDRNADEFAVDDDP